MDDLKHPAVIWRPALREIAPVRLLEPYRCTVAVDKTVRLSRGTGRSAEEDNDFFVRARARIDYFVPASDDDSCFSPHTLAILCRHCTKTLPSLTTLTCPAQRTRAPQQRKTHSRGRSYVFLLHLIQHLHSLARNLRKKNAQLPLGRDIVGVGLGVIGNHQVLKRKRTRSREEAACAHLPGPSFFLFRLTATEQTNNGDNYASLQ